MRHSKSKNFLPSDFDELLDVLAHPTAISNDDRRLLQSLDIKIREYPPRTVIRRYGEHQNRTFLIRSGWACTYLLLPDGGRQISDYHVRGDLLLGFDPIGRPSFDSLQSISEISLFEIPSRELFEILGDAPSLSVCLYLALARNSAFTVEHLANLGRRRAAVRTAHLLLELGVRLQKVGLADSEGYKCPLTQNDLADALGLTPIHVSRTLRELRQAGWVELHNGHLEFLDREALKRFAQFESGYIFGGSE